MTHHIDQLHPGMSASIAKTVTEADIILFAGISTDVNPAHLDEEYAKGTMFGGRIAHRMLFGGLHLGGAGQSPARSRHHYLSETLEFKAPVRRAILSALSSPLRKSMSSEPRHAGDRGHGCRQGRDPVQMPDDAAGTRTGCHRNRLNFPVG